MKYYIGLDGGGTKTKSVLTDESLNVLYECQGNASNFLMLGIEPVCQTIYNLICESLENQKLQFDQISTVVLGTTGAGRRTDAELLEKGFNEFLSQRNIKLNFHVESDARIALEGAFSGKPGSILIAGTGSIMFGKDKNSIIHRVGGFGRFIGDEGSGYSIGKLGLQAVAKSYDGRSQKTLLADLLKDNFNITDPSGLITEIYKNKFDIASVTPFVIKAAEMQDPECLKIINNQVDELILHVKSMYNYLNENTMKLSLIGSTITTDNFYAHLFQSRIKNELAFVELISPELPPALGAALMAKNL